MRVFKFHVPWAQTFDSYSIFHFCLFVFSFLWSGNYVWACLVLRPSLFVNRVKVSLFLRGLNWENRRTVQFVTQRRLVSEDETKAACSRPHSMPKYGSMCISELFVYNICLIRQEIQFFDQLLQKSHLNIDCKCTARWTVPKNLSPMHLKLLERLGFELLPSDILQFLNANFPLNILGEKYLYLYHF